MFGAQNTLSVSEGKHTPQPTIPNHPSLKSPFVHYSFTDYAVFNILQSHLNDCVVEKCS